MQTELWQQMLYSYLNSAEGKELLERHDLRRGKGPGNWLEYSGKFQMGIRPKKRPALQIGSIALGEKTLTVFHDHALDRLTRIKLTNFSKELPLKLAVKLIEEDSWESD